MALDCGSVLLMRYINSLQTLSYKVIKHQYRINCYRIFSINKTSFNKEKLTVELLPDVENLLITGELKHREHPGIRKIKPVILPEDLRSSVEKLISDEKETTLLNEAQNLCHRLSNRRLPVEQYEIVQKVNSMVPTFNGNFEHLSEIVNKKQLNQLRRRINFEMGRWKPIEYDHRTCLAYLAGRLAPNFASVSHLFDELKKVEPTFKPKTYFDFGSGVGSSLWAAHSHWCNSIKEYFCVDTSADMNTMCENLFTDEVTEEKFISPVSFRQFLPASDSVKYDLVVSAFSLLELPNVAGRLQVIDILWRKTKDFLVIVEHANAAGFHCVLDARDFILQVENDSSPEFSCYSSGAHVVSPCPHDFHCPKFIENPKSSCCFPVPYHPQFPRKFAQAVEKDWICYIIIKKGPRPDDYKTLPRIVKPVLRRAKHVHCRLCCSDGKLKEVIVTKGKHGKHAYRCARKSNQGDILPANIKPVEISSDTD